MEILRLCDPVYLAALTFMMTKATGGLKSIGDLMGGIIASALLYFVVKAPLLLLIGGFTWPASSNPNHHMAAGSIAFIPIAIMLGIANDKKNRLRKAR